jgi:putative endonuclease
VARASRSRSSAARTAPSRRWFVYMLLCRGGRIYTGVTPDVAARFAAHRAGRGAAFTRGFPPLRVLGARACAGRGAALKAEHALKQLDPAAKRRWAARWPWRAGATRSAPAARRSRR